MQQHDCSRRRAVKPLAILGGGGGGKGFPRDYNAAISQAQSAVKAALADGAELIEASAKRLGRPSVHRLWRLCCWTHRRPPCPASPIPG